MLEFVGILLGVVGILFAFETPRGEFLKVFGIKPKAAHPTSVSRVSPGINTEPPSPVSGATQSGRSPFFISEPFFELGKAKHESRRKSKPLFAVIYDDQHPTKSKLDYSLGCFVDYFATKKLLEQHFICALLQASASGVRDYVPEDDPLENALLVVLSPVGEILRREGVYANPDEGLKRIRSVIAQLADAKPLAQADYSRSSPQK